MISAKVSSAAELRRLERAGDTEARLRTGRSHAGDGRPAESGTRGESTGMLQTVRVSSSDHLSLTSAELVNDIRRS